jgi:hypothetical protein
LPAKTTSTTGDDESLPARRDDDDPRREDDEERDEDEADGAEESEDDDAGEDEAMPVARAEVKLQPSPRADLGTRALFDCLSLPPLPPLLRPCDAADDDDLDEPSTLGERGDGDVDVEVDFGVGGDGDEELWARAWRPVRPGTMLGRGAGVELARPLPFLREPAAPSPLSLSLSLSRRFRSSATASLSALFDLGMLMAPVSSASTSSAARRGERAMELMRPRLSSWRCSRLRVPAEPLTATISVDEEDERQPGEDAGEGTIIVIIIVTLCRGDVAERGEGMVVHDVAPDAEDGEGGERGDLILDFDLVFLCLLVLADEDEEEDGDGMGGNGDDELLLVAVVAVSSLSLSEAEMEVERSSLFSFLLRMARKENERVARFTTDDISLPLYMIGFVRSFSFASFSLPPLPSLFVLLFRSSFSSPPYSPSLLLPHLRVLVGSLSVDGVRIHDTQL